MSEKWKWRIRAVPVTVVVRGDEQVLDHVPALDCVWNSEGYPYRELERLFRTAADLVACIDNEEKAEESRARYR